MNPKMFPLLAILIVGVGYLSLHRPLQEQKTTLEQQQISLTEQTRVDQQATLMLINDLQAQLEELEPKRESIEATLPRELNPSDTLELIRENATRNNVRVDTTGIDDPVQNGDLKSITINLGVGGTYADLLAFTTDLENHSWPLTIDAINLETNERGANPGLDATFSLQIHAYNPMPQDDFPLDEWY